MSQRWTSILLPYKLQERALSHRRVDMSSTLATLSLIRPSLHRKRASLEAMTARYIALKKRGCKVGLGDYAARCGTPKSSFALAVKRAEGGMPVVVKNGRPPALGHVMEVRACASARGWCRELRRVPTMSAHSHAGVAQCAPAVCVPSPPTTAAFHPPNTAMQTVIKMLLLKMLVEHVPLYTRNVCSFARKVAADANCGSTHFGTGECSFGEDWAAAFRAVSGRCA